MTSEARAHEALARELISDHERHPHGAGLRDPFDVEVVHTNPVCGDRVRLRVALDGDVVRDVSWDALGCTISAASTSMMTDLVLGRPVAAALAARDRFTAMLRDRAADPDPDPELGDATALAGVRRHPARVPCALLGWAAFADAAARAVAAR